jgi:hypothetical protein
LRSEIGDSHPTLRLSGSPTQLTKNPAHGEFAPSACLIAPHDTTRYLHFFFRLIGSWTDEPCSRIVIEY